MSDHTKVGGKGIPDTRTIRRASGPTPVSRDKQVRGWPVLAARPVADLFPQKSHQLQGSPAENYLQREGILCVFTMLYLAPTNILLV